jgi:hypothetical protein
MENPVFENPVLVLTPLDGLKHSFHLLQTYYDRHYGHKRVAMLRESFRSWSRCGCDIPVFNHIAGVQHFKRVDHAACSPFQCLLYTLLSYIIALFAARHTLVGTLRHWRLWWAHTFCKHSSTGMLLAHTTARRVS